MISKAKLRKFLLLFIPPSFYPLIRRVLVSSPFAKSFYAPRWHTLSSGVFAGMSLFIDTQNEDWGEKILDGTYDDYFFLYIEKLKLKGAVVFDVGAHIGLSSLPFATLVGTKGMVVAFEPNPANRERLEMNREQNPSLTDRIVIEKQALGDKRGTQEFLFSGNIDDGTSSGSFLTNAHTAMERSIYEEQLSFGRMKVRTETLDHYVQKTQRIPSFIKIDVEGAEDLVLEGAKKTLRKYKPVLCIEYHSIHCAYRCTKLLLDLGYTLNVLHEEKDGRLFVAAR